MASSPHPGNTDNLHKSRFQRTVCLGDWWLVKAENDVQGRRLAVAGITDWGKQAMRVFTSAPIVKRYDVFTIETNDGICVKLEGFINKARTLENGFPSDVFNYFVFGFPPYWKECDEKFVAKVPSSKDISSNDLLKKVCQSPGAVEGAQPHEESREKYSGPEGNTESKVRQKSKKCVTFSLPLPKKQKCSESGRQKESYSGGTISVENHSVPELPVNELKNEMKSLSDLNCGGIKVQAVIDKHVHHSQILDNGGTLFACDLNKKRTKEAVDNLRKMDRDKKTRTNFDLDMSSERRLTRSSSRLKMKPTDNKKSVEELTPVSDQEPGSRNNCNSEEKLRLSDADSILLEEVKTNRKISKKKNEAMELHCKPATSIKLRRTSASEGYKRDSVSTGKNSLSQENNASEMKTSKKKAPGSKETPRRKKEKVQSVSPQSFSFNKSRSGRLLMPTLEFWRSQRAVYSVDRTITGINEGIPPTA